MIRIKKLPMTQVKVGMKVAHNVYTELGALLVDKDVVLDFRHIKSLRSLGIQAIEVYIDEDDLQLLTLRDIGYTAVLEEVRKFLNQIKLTNNMELDILANIIEGIRTIRRSEDIVLCLNENFGPEYYIYSHSLNVALLGTLIGKWLKLPEKQITQLVYAGILHDVGKLKVDPQILNKPGRLTDKEFAEIKNHPTYSYRLVEEVKFLSSEIKYGILMHHEREDGSGYPLGCKGDQIPFIAKVIAVADIYDAMTSNRVYSTESTPFRVFKMMEDQSYGRLDLNITRALLSNMANYYIGHRVILSNGEKGEIIFINPNRVSRPIIKTNTRFVDLSMEMTIQIERMSSRVGSEAETGDIE